MANEFLLPSVEEFSVDACDEFPTHSPIRVKIAIEKLEMHKRNLRKPESAAEAVQSKVDERTKDLSGKECTQAKKDAYTELHGCLDDEIQMRVHRMNLACQEKDSNRLWDLITACA